MKGNYFIIGQILTVFGYLTYYASRYCKEKEDIVKVEAVSKVIMSSSFLFIGSFSGVLSNLITMMRSILICIKEKRKQSFIAAYLAILVSCVLCGMMTYKNVFSTFSYVAAVITTTAAWFGNPQQIRKWGVVAGLFYMVFQISCMNVMGIIFEIGTVMMSLSAYIKYAVVKRV